MIKLMSLDTSTTSTGWAVFINGEYSYSGCISAKQTENKLSYMILSIFNLLNEECPDIVVAEEMVVPRNVQVARNLTMILGALYGKCLEKKIDWNTLRPT